MKHGKSLCVPVTVFVVLILGLYCNPAPAADPGIYLKVESFTWKEYDDSGSRLLKESGPIYAVGVSVGPDTAAPLVLGGRAELFGGTVGYDGQTQSGTAVETDTNYAGLKAEADLGWRAVVSERFRIEPFAGAGYRWWQRDIQDSDVAIGYQETWWSLYTRFGIRGEYIGTGLLTAFAEAGVKVPLITENEVDLSVIGISTVTVEPGNAPSGFAETGLAWDRFRASLFYEGMRFSKSDPVTVSGVQVWQPESKADIFGIMFGMDL